jgi:hypothetical protein
MSYQSKYLKYKNKYEYLKNQIGSGGNQSRIIPANELEINKSYYYKISPETTGFQVGKYTLFKHKTSTPSTESYTNSYVYTTNLIPKIGDITITPQMIFYTKSLGKNKDTVVRENNLIKVEKTDLIFNNDYSYFISDNDYNENNECILRTGKYEEGELYDYGPHSRGQTPPTIGGFRITPEMTFYTKPTAVIDTLPPL